MEILDAIHKRHACRAFLEKDVEPDVITQLLEAARWAASGVNTQPWQVHILTNKAKARLSAALIDARSRNLAPNPDYEYYPREWSSPYKERRKECGLKLYQVLGIKKGDAEGQMRAWSNNYTFFGAPTGIIFTVDKIMQTGSWLDMGLFMQNIMLGALEFDLATCPQASLADYPDIVRDNLALKADQLVVCGMSIGYPDQAAAVNQYRLAREPISDFTTWHDK